MMYNNPKLNLANRYIYKLSQIPSLSSGNIERKHNHINQGPHFFKNLQKVTRDNRNLDLSNIDAHTKLSQIPFFSIGDVERRQNSDINQRP